MERRQMLLTGVVLSVLGGALLLVGLFWSVDGLIRPPSMPEEDQSESDFVQANHNNQNDERLVVRLVFSKPQYDSSEPIHVDVFVRNITTKNIKYRKFHPYSSSVGLPCFMFSTDAHSEEFYLPPGLFGNDWNDWPRWPPADPNSPSDGMVTIPAEKEIHLLSGDLRAMITQARADCAHSLDSRLWDGQEHATTMDYYREIVAFCTRFLRDGGSYRVRVKAYGTSDAVPFIVAPTPPGQW